VTWGPEDERKHPRDAEGKWAEKLSDRIARIPSVPDFPADGQKMQAVEIGWRDRWFDDRSSTAKFRLSKFEIWHPNQGTWEDGANARYVDDSGLFLDDPEGYGRDLHWTPSAPVFIRGKLAVTGKAAQRGNKPDPTQEYLFNDEEQGMTAWLPGSRIDVDPETGMWEAYDASFGDQDIPYRPHYPPTSFDDQITAYGFTQDDFARNGMIRTVWLQDVYDQPSYLQGGYQMLGEDGNWHTLEEIYKLYPEDPDSSEVELIAGDLHFPEIDLATELTVRRTPMDY
jgi:hypothetical protein